MLVSVAVVGVVGPGIGVPAAQRWGPCVPGIVGLAEVGGGRSGWSRVADQIGDWRGVYGGVRNRRPDGVAEGQTRRPGVPGLPQHGLKIDMGQRSDTIYRSALQSWGKL